MIVACPSCHKKIKAPDSAAGKKAKCPSCGTVMMLPAAVQDAEVVDQNMPPTPPANDPFSTLPSGGGLSDLLDEADQMYSLEKKPGGLPSTSDPFAAGSSSPAADAAVPRRPCPACGEMIMMSALKCHYCGETFDPGLKKKRRRSGSGDDEDLTPGDWVVAILCSGIGCIAGIVWMIQGKPKGGKMLAVSVAANVFWGIVRVILEVATANM